MGVDEKGDAEWCAAVAQPNKAPLKARARERRILGFMAI
jgi:hypothetical protein